LGGPGKPSSELVRDDKKVGGIGHYYGRKKGWQTLWQGR